MKSVSVQWFEIPVGDMDRAINFYQKVFECELSKQVLDDFQMAWFPFDPEKGGASGSLVYHQEFYEISTKSWSFGLFGVD
jgi:Predicted enzyme related to lactoylglutathione lyase